MLSPPGSPIIILPNYVLTHENRYYTSFIIFHIYLIHTQYETHHLTGIIAATFDVGGG